jgi:hypothetical protein
MLTQIKRRDRAVVTAAICDLFGNFSFADRRDEDRLSAAGNAGLAVRICARNGRAPARPSYRGGIACNALFRIETPGPR